MGSVTPLCSFRVFPSTKSRLFSYVRIFSSLKKMYQWVKDTPNYGAYQGTDYAALCRTWESRLHGRLSPALGEILLVKNRLGPNAVTHECMHATFEFMRRKKIPFPDRLKPQEAKAEEIVCHSVGDMTSQIYIGLGKYGVLQ